MNRSFVEWWHYCSGSKLSEQHWHHCKEIASNKLSKSAHQADNKRNCYVDVTVISMAEISRQVHWKLVPDFSWLLKIKIFSDFSLMTKFIFLVPLFPRPCVRSGNSEHIREKMTDVFPVSGGYPWSLPGGMWPIIWPRIEHPWGYIYKGCRL